jgi:hypothetical protein
MSELVIAIRTYFILPPGAFLRADGLDSFVPAELHRSRLVPEQAPVVPITDLDVIKGTVLDPLIVHDVVTTGWIPVLVELYRLLFVVERYVHQIILKNQIFHVSSLIRKNLTREKIEVCGFYVSTS